MRRPFSVVGRSMLEQRAGGAPQFSPTPAGPAAFFCPNLP